MFGTEARLSLHSATYTKNVQHFYKIQLIKRNCNWHTDIFMSTCQTLCTAKTKNSKCHKIKIIINKDHLYLEQELRLGFRNNPRTTENYYITPYLSVVTCSMLLAWIVSADNQTRGYNLESRKINRFRDRFEWRNTCERKMFVRQPAFYAKCRV